MGSLPPAGDLHLVLERADAVDDRNHCCVNPPTQCHPLLLELCLYVSNVGLELGGLACAVRAQGLQPGLYEPVQDRLVGALLVAVPGPGAELALGVLVASALVQEAALQSRLLGGLGGVHAVLEAGERPPDIGDGRVSAVHLRSEQVAEGLHDCGLRLLLVPLDIQAPLGATDTWAVDGLAAEVAVIGVLPHKGTGPQLRQRLAHLHGQLRDRALLLLQPQRQRLLPIRPLPRFPRQELTDLDQCAARARRA
mmetsp:Transcript_91983/g.269041  ORF Transcript_91983/g.269041 Transcript_91983/m.269041 type:complete len:252 (+) Transcript_91983:643-1398(+)